MSKSKSQPKKLDRDTVAILPPKGFAWAQVLMLVVVTLAVLRPVCKADFIYWDDWMTVAQNPVFNPASSESLTHYWTTSHMELWVPVTYTIWGILANISPRLKPNDIGITLDPSIFHSANLLVHVISVCLVFAILRRLIRRDWPAMFGAMLFAVHPVQVESVAWMSGLKDVLAGMFGLLSLRLFLWADEKRFDIGAFTRRMLLATVAFVLAMLSKPSAVVWPVLIGVIVSIYLHRFAKQDRKIYIWLLGWLILTIPVLVIGRISQPAPLVNAAPLSARPFIAGDSIAFYLGKLFYPVDLRFDYGRRPFWVISQGSLMYLTSAVTLALLVTAGLLYRRANWFSTGVALFVLAPFPVLGFVTFEFQYFSSVADHYQYVAMFGPALILAAVCLRLPLRAAGVGCALLVGVLSVLSFRQVKLWNNMELLQKHLFEIDPKCQSGYYVAAATEKRKGNLDKAIAYYQQAIEVAPDHAALYYDYGNALVIVGRYDEAEKAYHQALSHGMSNDADVHYMLGVSLAKQRRYPEAEDAFAGALRLDPQHQNAIQGMQTLQRMKLPVGP